MVDHGHTHTKQRSHFPYCLKCGHSWLGSSTERAIYVYEECRGREAPARPAVIFLQIALSLHLSSSTERTIHVKSAGGSYQQGREERPSAHADSLLEGLAAHAGWPHAVHAQPRKIEHRQGALPLLWHGPCLREQGQFLIAPVTF